MALQRKSRPSFVRNALAGIGETVVQRPPWELIAIAALGVAALANVMLYIGKRMGTRA